MDISKTQIQPSPLRYDLTKPNRESIKERQPLDQPVETSADPAIDQDEAAKAVREARDAYRDQRQTRIANARAHRTYNMAQQVTAARNEYRAGLDQRMKNTSGAGASTGPKGADRLEISAESKALVERAQQAAAQNSTSRTERLAELKSLHEQGKLNTDELVARAAQRILGGE